jgi:alkylation response protein AidB-like acyl-CoA dehydrogenase
MTVTSEADAELGLLRETAAELSQVCRERGTGSVEQHQPCWEALRASGFADLRADDGDGQPQASATQCAVVMEEKATAVCPSPLAGSLIASELLRLAGASSLGADEAPSVLLGSDLATLGTGAGLIWDSAFTTGGLAVDGDEPILAGIAEEICSADPLRRLSRPAACKPIGGRIDPARVNQVQTFARVMLAAELLGTARGVFEQAVGYVKERVQFGRPIGAFQAIQHLAARAFVRLEAMRSTMHHAAAALDTADVHEAADAAVIAKSYTSQGAVEVIETAVQMFGGIAITWEFPAHHHLRRALLDRVVLGTPDRLLPTLALDSEESR